MSLTDRELIQQIKSNPTDAAIIELVNRHTGIYVNIIDRYSHINPSVISKQDLIDQRMTNIYTYALDYRLDSPMQFGTYVGQRIKFECKNLLREAPTEQQLERQIVDTEMNSDDNDHEIQDDETIELATQLLELAHKNEDYKFAQIIKYRFFSGTGVLPWREIGKKMDMSHEGVRKHFILKLKELKTEMVKEKYV
jgi:hypothetical protein